jgi:hypothetical protein
MGRSLTESSYSKKGWRDPAGRKLGLFFVAVPPQKLDTVVMEGVVDAAQERRELFDD